MSKKITLIIPNNNSQHEWFSLVNDCLKIKEKIEIVIVDFNEVKFLETDEIVVLACLLEMFHKNGVQIEFVGGTNELNKHLDNIKFKKYWSGKFNREEYTESLNSSTLCPWKINPEMVYSYSNYAKKYFEGIVKDKDLLPLASNMDEVFNNILDHAGSPVQGYIITQFYPKPNCISFSVCDFGIGIPTSVNKYLLREEKYVLEDVDALMKALELGFSVKSTPNNRGLGLDNILTLIENSKGSLLIRSNNASLFKEAGKSFKVGKMAVSFPGTLIKVSVNLNTFDKKDEDETIFEF
jgi:anti-anti-sigma regulatory factor